jgi:hypothetical protein
MMVAKAALVAGGVFDLLVTLEVGLEVEVQIVSVVILVLEVEESFGVDGNFVTIVGLQLVGGSVDELGSEGGVEGLGQDFARHVNLEIIA